MKSLHEPAKPWLETGCKNSKQIWIQFHPPEGSHIILMNKSGRMVVVPKHDPIKIGMLAAILEQAEISKEDFLKHA